MAASTDLRIGLIGRAEARGLGVQSLEFARHLRPAVLLLDVPEQHGYPPNLAWYPHATRVRFDGRFSDERTVRRWLETVDVVYAAETLYDGRFGAWAARADVATVVHVNPEFHKVRHGWTDPAAWWAPTVWRLDHLPAGTTVVPVPVAHARWPARPDGHDGRCRWVHVTGRQALGDRNGTDAVVSALRFLREPCTVRFVVQDPHVTVNVARLPRHVEAHVVGGVADYWELYGDADALVLPRRYGGLSLVANEAAGAGLGLLMTDVVPNPQTWPCATVPVRRGVEHRMPAGTIEAAGVDGRQLAAAMDRFADPAYRAEHQERAREWADVNSWERWSDRYRELLACVCR